MASILRRVDVGESSFRLSAFWGVLSFSLFDMLLVRGVLSIWFVHVSLAVYPHWWFLLFAWTWILPSCTFFPLIWVFCFIDVWQVFIMYFIKLHKIYKKCWSKLWTIIYIPLNNFCQIFIATNVIFCKICFPWNIVQCEWGFTFAVCWGPICKDNFFGILIHAQEHGDMIKYHFFGHVGACNILAGISP